MGQQRAYLQNLICAAAMACLLLAAPAQADFFFGEPVNLGPVANTPVNDGSACLSPDGLELYTCSDRSAPGLGTWNLWVARRPSGQEAWKELVVLGPEVNSIADDVNAQLSFDGLELYFNSDRPDGRGGGDIWVTTRLTLADQWGPAVNLGPQVNSSGTEMAPAITGDGLRLFFGRTASGAAGFDLWVASRMTREEPWGTATQLGMPVNTSASEAHVSVSADGLALFFSSHPYGPFRAGGHGGSDIWVTTRPMRDDPWETPWNPGPPLNTSYPESVPAVSPDGRWLYFGEWLRPRPGGHGGEDVRKAPIIPVTDFNGDGVVGGEDVLAFTQCWGTDDSLCDIGPMPWGDRIVGVEDLKVLAEYIGQDVVDGTLVAHWALDETEGDIAYDRTGAHDAAVMGTCTWQPDGGHVEGALAFDGTTAIRADLVLDPAGGSFGALAWVQGGAPGQVIVSQTDGVNWLMIDPVAGTLATELIPPTTRFPVPPLVSDASIADGRWHRVAFAWDGGSRNLYVDGALVATDEQPSLAPCEGGLNIGCAADQDPATFFTGLIDDVRIYNRAVRP